jgi:hypothetical protein
MTLYLGVLGGPVAAVYSLCDFRFRRLLLVPMRLSDTRGHRMMATRQSIAMHMRDGLARMIQAGASPCTPTSVEKDLMRCSL